MARKKKARHAVVWYRPQGRAHLSNTVSHEGTWVAMCRVYNRAPSQAEPVDGWDQLTETRFAEARLCHACVRRLLRFHGDELTTEQAKQLTAGLPERNYNRGPRVRRARPAVVKSAEEPTKRTWLEKLKVFFGR